MVHALAEAAGKNLKKLDIYEDKIGLLNPLMEYLGHAGKLGLHFRAWSPSEGINPAILAKLYSMKEGDVSVDTETDPEHVLVTMLYLSWPDPLDQASARITVNAGITHERRTMEIVRQLKRLEDEADIRIGSFDSSQSILKNPEHIPLSGSFRGRYRWSVAWGALAALFILSLYKFHTEGRRIRQDESLGQVLSQVHIGLAHAIVLSLSPFMTAIISLIDLSLIWIAFVLVYEKLHLALGWDFYISIFLGAAIGLGIAKLYGFFPRIESKLTARWAPAILTIFACVVFMAMLDLGFY